MHSATVAIVTTCKGRLAHLQAALPTFVAQPGCRVVVVDYDCPDHASDWIAGHYPEVEVVALRDAPAFNVSRARNLGAAAARTEWLVFADADQRLSANFIANLAPRMKAGIFLRPAANTVQGPVRFYHPIVCTSTAFAAVGGYDDEMRGWGMEDADLLLRLAQHGQTEALYPTSLFRTEHHSEAMRVRYYESDRIQSRVVNLLYAELKHRYRESRKSWLDAAQRSSAYAAIVDVVRAAQGDSPAMQSYDVAVEGAQPPWVIRMRHADILERLQKEHDEMRRSLADELRATVDPPTSTHRGSHPR